jgi:transcriptional regulator
VPVRPDAIGDGHHRPMRSEAEVEWVLELRRDGLSQSEIARVTGIARTTVRD